MVRILRWSILIASLLYSVAIAQPDEKFRRQEKREISKLAALTLTDHSTIFFSSLTESGYVRDGKPYSSTIHCTSPRGGDAAFCGVSAVSHDGFRIAYVPRTTGTGNFSLLIRDLKTGKDSTLARLPERPRLLSWSWDDAEVAYEGDKGIFGISTAAGSVQTLMNLPLKIHGKVPTEGWHLKSIDWQQGGGGLLLEAKICVPMREPGSCHVEGQVLLCSIDDCRMILVGENAAISPTRDKVAYIANATVIAANLDGSNPKVITTVPSTLFLLPFLKEEPWTKIVWSPNADRLWFNTIIDEGGNTNLYLVDLKNGHRRRFLKHTLVTVTDWR